VEEFHWANALVVLLFTADGRRLAQTFSSADLAEEKLPSLRDLTCFLILSVIPESDRRS
jgi:hypothetical protein